MSTFRLDAYQNDYDNDGLTYWEEVNVYGTSASVKNNKYVILISLKKFS